MENEIVFTEKELAFALDEWLTLYMEQPEKFEQEWVTVRRRLQELDSVSEPTYGESGVAFIKRILQGDPWGEKTNDSVEVHELP